MPNLEIYGTFDGNNSVGVAVLAQAILDDKVKLSDDTVIGLFDADVSMPLSNGNFAYKCHGVIAKADDMNDTGDYPHIHYDVRIEIHVERVPCPDDIKHN